MAQLYVGIDLGTTNSTVSVIQTEDRRLRNPIDHLRSIPILQYDKDFNLTRDKYTLPSYFYCKNDGKTKRVYTGEWAKNIYATGNQPMNTFTGIKTRMGGESMITIPGKSEDDELQLDMTQCSALLLKTMKQSIEEQFDQEIDHLVVTVPAAFNTDERQATRDAIEMAGFTNFHILDEPAATLLYFINNGDGCLMQNSVDLNNKYIMIYDIGGGTLDICIAKLEEDDTSYEYESMKVSIASRSKRENLGGNDFDQYLGAYFLSEFENRTAKINTRPVENKIIARVVSQAEKYKIDLNNKLKEHIDNPRKLSRIVMTPEFEVINGQFVQGINLDKATLEEVYAGIITDSDRQNILRPVKESIKSAENLSKEDISLIILTGGMSNFYAVEATLKEFFGDEVPMITVDTTTSVSKGAAIDAYNYSPDNIHLKKMSLEDRLAEDIFLRTNTGFEKLISKSEISTKKKGQFTYTIQQENMTNLPIFLFYGQDTNFTEDFTQIAGKMVPLPRRFDVGEQVTLEWSIDQNGVITISLDELGEEIKLNQGANQELLAKKKIIDEIQIN